MQFTVHKKQKTRLKFKVGAILFAEIKAASEKDQSEIFLCA